MPNSYYTTNIPAPQSDVQTLVNSFIFRCQASGFSKGTIYYYQVKFKKFLKFCTKENVVSPSHITSNLIRQYLVFLKEVGHNNGGVHAHFRVIRAFLNWYEKEHEPDFWSNPIKKVEPPKLTRKPLDAITITDIHALLSTCVKDNFTDIRDRAIILSLLDTGMRANELLQLNLDDLNLSQGQCQIKAGKGGDYRLAILGVKTREAIISYLAIRPQCDCRALWTTLPSTQTTRLKYSGLRSMLRRRSDKAGIETPAIHSFRRAFAMTLLREGVNIYTLAKLMGHSSINTLKHYLKHTTNDIEIAHRRHGPVDNVLFKCSTDTPELSVKSLVLE